MEIFEENELTLHRESALQVETFMVFKEHFKNQFVAGSLDGPGKHLKARLINVDHFVHDFTLKSEPFSRRAHMYHSLFELGDTLSTFLMMYTAYEADISFKYKNALLIMSQQVKRRLQDPEKIAELDRRFTDNYVNSITTEQWQNDFIWLSNVILTTHRPQKEKVSQKEKGGCHEKEDEGGCVIV